MRSAVAAVTGALLLNFGALPTWALTIVGIVLLAAAAAVASGIATELATR